MGGPRTMEESEYESEEESDEEKTTNSNHLKESESENHVCLIGDTDLLSEEHFLIQQRFLLSQNVSFVQNIVDHFGDDTLINIRSRIRMASAMQTRNISHTTKN